MAKFRVFIKKSAAKEIESIDTKKQRIAVINRIQSLADNPRIEGSIKLTNDNKYRIRQGDYRILYQIFDDLIEVCIVKVAHRKHVYRKKR